ncbi:nitroreductase family deazaflavin-dependent oxidoreductase [Mycobacterium sp. C31M]
MNPVFRRLAPYAPGFAVIEHTGRRSGRTYATPVNAFRAGTAISFGMGHGRSDWVKNILAVGHADIRHVGRRWRLVNPRVVTRDQSKVGLPLAARLVGLRVDVLVADIESRDGIDPR